MTISKDDAHKYSIVVVNDDCVQRQLLVGLLEQVGYQIAQYSGPTEALPAMEAGEPPDLVVTDLYMPDMDGWKFCRLLRSEQFKAYNEIPILVVSATYSGKEAQDITRQISANAFLPMPVNGRRFLDCVSSMLSGEIPVILTRALIVDDCAELAEGLKEEFIRNGYQVDVVPSRAECLELIQSYAYEVVILEQEIPDAPGGNLLEEIRERSLRSAIIMITSDPNPDLAVEWLARGANAYVKKPFSPQYIIQLSENALREKSLLYIEDLLELRTKEIREKERTWRNLFEGSGAMTAVVETDMRICFANGDFMRLTGCAPEDFDSGASLGQFLDDEDRRRLSKALRSIADGINGEQKLLDLKLSGADETVHYMVTNVRPFTDGSRFIISMIDVTERRQAEIERQYVVDNAVATQKYESLGVLAGGMAHEYNNIMMGLQGNVELARMALESNQPMKDYLDFIEAGAVRASNLTRQILAYSGKGRMKVEPIALNELIEALAHLFQNVFYKNTTFQTDLADDLPQIKADSAQMKQIVMNLVTNACEALGERSSGRLTIRTTLMDYDPDFFSQLTIATRMAEGPYVSLEVSDSGEGMTPETMQRMFDPFFTTKFPGRGLGLAAVLGIVKGHNGNIHVASRLNEGTTIRLLFPALDGPLVSRSSGKTQATGAPRKALLADDEESVRAITGRMLDRLGYEVLYATDGEEALQAFLENEEQFEFILLDVSMPKLTGIDVARRIRETHPSIPIILASGFSEQDFSVDLAGKHHCWFIEKPFGFSKFKSLLAEIEKTKNCAAPLS